MAFPPYLTSIAARLRAARVRTAGIYLGASVLARAGAFFLIPLYTRRLSAAEYGEYALAQTLVALLSTPLTLGMLAAVNRFYFTSDDVAASRARSGSAAKWVVLVAVLGGLLCAALVMGVVPAGGHGVGGRHELLCATVAAVGTSLAQIPVTFSRAAQRPLTAAAFQLVEFVASVGSGLLLVAGLDRGLQGAIEALALSGLVTGTFGAAFAIFVMPGRLELQTLRDALRFSLPFVPHAAGNQIQAISDRWLLKWTGQSDAIGPYALAAQLTSPVMMVLQSWHEAATPALGEVFRKRGLVGLREEMGRTRRSFALVAAIPGVLLSAALPIAFGVFHLAGDRFSSALLIAPFICLSLVVESLYYAEFNVLYYADRSSWIPPITFSAGGLNVILNLVLISSFGVVGALAARLISMSFRSLLMHLAARRCFAPLDSPPVDGTP